MTALLLHALQWVAFAIVVAIALMVAVEVLRCERLDRDQDRE